MTGHFNPRSDHWKWKALTERHRKKPPAMRKVYKSWHECLRAADRGTGKMARKRSPEACLHATADHLLVRQYQATSCLASPHKPIRIPKGASSSTWSPSPQHPARGSAGRARGRSKLADINKHHTFNNTTSTVLSTLEMSHRLYRLLWRSYILSTRPQAEAKRGEQSPPWTPEWPRCCALPTTRTRARRSPPRLLALRSTPACPSLLTGKRKSQSCDRLIKSSWNRFAYAGDAGTYSKQKVLRESFLRIWLLLFFVAAKNGISLPVILITKSFPGNFDIQKAPEWKSWQRKEQKPDECNRDAPRGESRR